MIKLMKKEPGFLYQVALVFGDAFAIISSFAFAYYYRIHFDSRPYFFESELLEFVLYSLMLLPIWVVILSSFGLYTKRVINRRFLVAWKLLLASVVGIMSIITVDFFFSSVPGHTPLFPVKTMVVYAAIFCYVFLLLERLVIGLIRRFFLRRSLGAMRTLVIGDSENTRQLLASVTPDTGFKIVGVIAGDKYIPEGSHVRRYDDVEIAIKRLHPDAIIHTESENIEAINRIAVENHALYYFSPSEDSIITLGRDVEFLAATPIILVRTTPLAGAAIIYKRAMDIVLSLLGLILTLPIMLVIFIIQKLIDFKAPAFYCDRRLTRFNCEFSLIKFRSIKPEYSGLTPEQAFEKMGKPELAVRYRKHGDYLRNDPRYTRFGNFLRRSSLDELPQLVNVLFGDISLVGPRALQPEELKDYGDRGIILSVKSGLTGLAQVSGRRDISFAERRAFDVYYVQHWTPALDIQIIFRTFFSVLKRDGAK